MTTMCKSVKARAPIRRRDLLRAPETPRSNARLLYALRGPRVRPLASPCRAAIFHRSHRRLIFLVGAARDDLERVVGQGLLHALASSQGTHPEVPFFIACQSTPASPSA